MFFFFILSKLYYVIDVQGEINLKGVLLLLLLLLFSYELAKSDKFSVGLIAQLVEHWFGLAQVMGVNP